MKLPIRFYRFAKCYKHFYCKSVSYKQICRIIHILSDSKLGIIICSTILADHLNRRFRKQVAYGYKNLDNRIYFISSTTSKQYYESTIEFNIENESEIPI